jgi:branched-chain amino acid transport system permease protein
MTILVAGIISGLQLGLLYGLLALALVLLYKATGLANFAIGSMATLAAFIIYRMVAANVPVPVAIALGAVMSLLVGSLIYFLVLRPKDSSGSFNLTIRTVALYLLIAAAINTAWGAGQPFSFPSLFPGGSFDVGGVRVSFETVGKLAVMLVIVALVAVFFLATPWGLLMRAVAADPESAALIGVNVRLMTALAWVGASFLAMIAGVLTAPTALLSVDMMDAILPFAFTGAVVGGLTSLPGALVGSIIVGLLSGITQVYTSSSTALYVVFVVLIATLLIKPAGLFGRTLKARL